MRKNIAIIGSREIPEAMVQEIQKVARGVLDRGDTVVTGGAWGADYRAMLAAHEQKAYNQLKVFLPQGIEGQRKYYQSKGEDIAAVELLKLLKIIQKRNSDAIETISKKFNRDTYGKSCLKRNQLIVGHADELHAFRNMESASEKNPTRPSGTQITVNLAKEKGMPIYQHQ